MFDKVKNDILGKDYDLSIAFVSEKKSRELNKKWRYKDKATNVLSFSLRKDTGELVLCNAVIKKETKKFDKTFPQLVGFLVIHGMLHLKGMRHSSTMERAEKKYCKKYGKKYFSRNRRGLRNDESRSGRVRKRRKKS
ncbi:rRNA maturation RNase YbeY [Candidatus Nomurabacteria bacterium RIFCSPLOWO2_02_40_28]|nr:MAG: rRNA maturation RNase YbeY [Candidatus Nomurabacteria bacterium RIFCSPHIGHO2_02_40_30]OGI82992.1 MAG: rRNA maturation RNase YbeY [Candidatus Nomurabacteria bacterium RIFCSPHIGHO2_12_FULL_40_77]OGI96237.1 MAG: rRNA maturation RNase YbeY [Candidatus Nomurabacteria bacterium RIFCSPLOWO2_02_40_28]OGI98894.1 MAG: rRNA maturation RNase YbeY [Candidatus Nomurabacteria bacterium RIFCSPLOWO2_12_40_14]HBA45914.1 rRNA maturation RNase YbeY [Candidatus Nomurabacteria bacterium]